MVWVNRNTKEKLGFGLEVTHKPGCFFLSAIDKSGGIHFTKPAEKVFQAVCLILKQCVSCFETMYFFK